MSNNPREKYKPTHNLAEVKQLLEANCWRASKYNAIVKARDLYGISKEGIKQVILELKMSDFRKSCIYPENNQIEDWQDSYITNFDGYSIYIKLKIVENDGRRWIVVSFHGAD